MLKEGVFDAQRQETLEDDEFGVIFGETVDNSKRLLEAKEGVFRFFHAAQALLVGPGKVHLDVGGSGNLGGDGRKRRPRVIEKIKRFGEGFFQLALGSLLLVHCFAACVHQCVERVLRPHRAFTQGVFQLAFGGALGNLVHLGVGRLNRGRGQFRRCRLRLREVPRRPTERKHAHSNRHGEDAHGFAHVGIVLKAPK